VASTFFTDEKDYNSVDSELKAAVDEFNSSLMHYGNGVGFKVFDLLQGILVCSKRLTPRRIDLR
jgi:hypothetical protein